MALALKEAEAAALRGEVPVGAVIANGSTVVASAGNRTRELADPTAHAEMLVIRETCGSARREGRQAVLRGEEALYPARRSADGR